VKSGICPWGVCKKARNAVEVVEEVLAIALKLGATSVDCCCLVVSTAWQLLHHFCASWRPATGSPPGICAQTTSSPLRVTPTITSGTKGKCMILSLLHAGDWLNVHFGTKVLRQI
jgi:hypothetical protein